MEDELQTRHYSQEEVEELARRLAEAEATLEAVLKGEIDAVVSESGPLLLAEAQKALRRSEERLSYVLEASLMGLWEFDLQDHTAFRSPRHDRIFGYDSLLPEWTYEMFLDHVVDEDRSVIDEGFRYAVAHRTDWNVECRIRRADGEIRWIRKTGHHRAPPDQRQVMVGLVEDITVHRRMVEELDRGKRDFQTILDAAPIMIAYKDSDGRFVRVNKAWAEFAGVPAEEIVGKTIFDVVKPESAARRLVDEYLEVMRTGSLMVNRLMKWSGHDGPEIWTSYSVMPFYEEGRIMGTISFVQDVDARVRAEDALRASEHQVRQKLRLEAVGSLAGGIAHDFNNLLTVIIGQTEALRDTLDAQSDERGRVDEIRTVADRAASLTRQLLAFSRQQPLQPRVLSINDVVESMTDLLTRILGEDIALLLRCVPTLRPIEADPGQLEQVIMNLAVNARDAMAGGGTLVIETSNVDLDAGYAAANEGFRVGPHACLVVSDTGCGMDESTLRKVFEPFFTTKEVGKGSGLGLSTAYGIVTQSGGNICAYSEPGHGSTFRLYFPVVGSPVDWVPEGPTEQREQRGGTETIAVIEDEPQVRSLVVRVLERAGYTVLQEGDLVSGLRLLEARAGEVHLLLTDVVLPGGSGKVLAEAVAARSGVSPRLLYMSGYTRSVLVNDGRLSPDVSLLEKPFAPEGLLRKVREVLDGPIDGRSTPSD